MGNLVPSVISVSIINVLKTLNAVACKQALQFGVSCEGVSGKQSKLRDDWGWGLLPQSLNPLTVHFAHHLHPKYVQIYPNWRACLLAMKATSLETQG